MNTDSNSDLLSNMFKIQLLGVIVRFIFLELHAKLSSAVI